MRLLRAFGVASLTRSSAAGWGGRAIDRVGGWVVRAVAFGLLVVYGWLYSFVHSAEIALVLLLLLVGVAAGAAVMLRTLAGSRQHRDNDPDLPALLCRSYGAGGELLHTELLDEAAAVDERWLRPGGRITLESYANRGAAELAQQAALRGPEPPWRPRP